jgi:hypothetical protein
MAIDTERMEEINKNMVNIISTVLIQTLSWPQIPKINDKHFLQRVPFAITLQKYRDI